MNRLIGSFTLGMFFSASICGADITGLSAPAIDLQPIIVKKDVKDFPKPDLEKSAKPVPAQIQVPPKKAAWKIEFERWYKEEIKDSPDLSSSRDLVSEIQTQRPYEGFLSSFSPKYNINRNFLSLVKIPNKKPREAFMFIFLMNNPHYKYKDRPHEDYQRMKMHILWTGGKKMMMEQKFIKNEYPIDVSIANYQDGYAEGEWNLVLPSKKPREVKVSLLWSF